MHLFRSSVLPAVSLLICWLTRAGLALHASSAQTGESAANTRFFRNPDRSDAEDTEVMHIELDSAGKGRLDASQPVTPKPVSAVLEVRGASSVVAKDDSTAVDTVNLGSEARQTSSGPQVVNGGFEQGSDTDNYEYATSVPGWSTIGSGATFIKSGSTAFQGIGASHGDYLMGLMGEGSGVFQSVSGHEVGKWYRLMYHSGYRTTYGEAKLKVSVDATEKFNQEVFSGTLGWYEVTYKAPYADVVITLEHSGPSGDRTVFIDGIDIQPVEMWDKDHGNSHQVLLQKVTCNGYPSSDSCTRGRFLSVGDYDEDGATSIVETNAASEAAVWVALHEDNGNRWSFKSASLTQASPGNDSGPPRSADMWFLHGDYSSCEARNWMSRATSTFDVVMNGMGLHELSDVGTECGSLFAVQKFENAHTIVER